MTSKERIKKIFEFKKPDRVGIYDSFCDQTLEKWQLQGYPQNVNPEKYFDFDFQLFNLDDASIEKKIETEANNDKFLTLSFSGPFERISCKIGKLNLLKELAINPKKSFSLFNQELDYILDSVQSLFKKGIIFDGAWVWSDLAYKDNLFFSAEIYKKWLFPIHKRLFSFLNSHDLPIIFHSDGKINDLIPYLLDAGIRSLHPLDCSAEIDISDLSKRFGDRLVFFGNIDIGYIDNRNLVKKELEKKLAIIKNNCFYIYHAAQPVWSGVTLEDYKFLLETIKDLGSYRC